MAQLRVESTELTEDFRRLLTGLKVPAPWGATEDGQIFAANRRAVLQVDPDRNMPDGRVAQIAKAIELAVNTCAGFKAVAP